MTATAGGVGERLLANTREENCILASVTGVGLVRAISFFASSSVSLDSPPVIIIRAHNEYNYWSQLTTNQLKPWLLRALLDLSALASGLVAKNHRYYILL